jgi:hypothetical protein
MMRKCLGAESGKVAHSNPVGLRPYERNGTDIGAQGKYVVVVLKENDGLLLHLVEKVSGGLCSQCGCVIRIRIRV